MIHKEAFDRFEMLVAAHAELVHLKGDFALLRADIEASFAERDQLESRLGTALAEIARLEAALRQAAGMKTIKGARRIVADALNEKEP